MNVLTIPPIILLTVLSVGFIYYQLVTRKFTATANRATAKIISNKRYQATKSSVFIPTIVFTDQNGQEITLEARLSGASSLSRKAYQPGDELVILYEPSNPKNFIIDSWYGRYVYTFKKAAVAILVVILAGIIFMLLR